MFAQKKVLVRIIKPNRMIIEPTFIAVPLPNGEGTLLLQGSFEDVQDQEALTLATRALARTNVA